MGEISTIGLDIAKSVFQVHGVVGRHNRTQECLQLGEQRKSRLRRPTSEFDAVDGAHSAASKCHRVVALKQTTLRGAVHGRS